MPKQETVFEEQTEGGRVEVLKVYDQNYAREAFQNMDADARMFLWNTLNIPQNYEPAEVPSFDDPSSEDFLWEELLDSAREDGNVLSFFVVNETNGSVSKSVYVSPDWSSAETFAKTLS